MARNAAFEILYREYYARVFGLCRRLLSSPELAEDATQETFMRAYRNDPEQAFWHWIATIANNHCIDVLRHQNRTRALFGDESVELEGLAGAETTALSDLVSAQEAEVLNAAVGNLAPKYRVPIVLAYFNQLSYDEIASQLDISRNHVGVLILRAKQRLRSELAADAEVDR